MSNRYPAARSATSIGVGVDSRYNVGRRTYVSPASHRRAFRRTVSPLLPKPREFVKVPAWPAPAVKPRPFTLPSPPVRRIPRFPRVISRMFPWLGWAMIGYELTRWTFPSRTMNSDAIRYCANFPAQDYKGNIHYLWSSTPTGFCTSRTVSDAAGGYAPGTPWLREYVDGGTSPGGQPLMWGRKQMWFDKPGPLTAPGLPGWIPGWVIPVDDPLPAWVTGPLSPPLAGQPAPFPPPIWRRPPRPPIERGDPLKWPRDRPVGRPDKKPVFTPDPEGVVNNPPKPRPRPRPTTDPVPVPWARPGRRVKEKKVRVAYSVRALLLRLLSEYSEFVDLVEALYKGVPKELRTKNADLFQMMRDIYNAGDRYDMVAAIQAIFEENAHDRVWGKALRQASKNFDAYGVELPWLRDGFTYLVK